MAIQVERQRALALVSRYGWNTTCFQTLNPGVQLWFSASREGFIAFVERSGVRVVAGAPICRASDLPEIVAEFDRQSPAYACYFGAEERVKGLLSGTAGYATVILGSQPVWHPAVFVERFMQIASLRAQLNRAINKGLSIREWSIEEATDDRQLKKCLSEWLSTRGLPPLHFLVEPETLRTLEGRRIFVAERGSEAVAFVVLAPIPERNGWLTEQFVRGAKCPNGGIELCLHRAAQAICADGSQYLTMGIVPLSAKGEPIPSRNPRWLRLLESWMRAHARRFYNFDGLEAFKEKFRPSHWEPVYVVAREPDFSWRTLYAIAAAFTGKNPFLAVTLGLLRAVKNEARTLGRFLKRKLSPRHRAQGKASGKVSRPA